MYYLQQWVHSNRLDIHGTGDNVSELIAYYYKWRKQYGYMEIVDENDNVLVTFGSKGV